MAHQGVGNEAGPKNQLEPVLIAGAGLSGLVLAQALHRAGIQFRVYEKGPAPTEMGNGLAQGYRIRLDAETLTALESVLPDQTFRAVKSNIAIDLPFGGAFDAVSGAERDFGMIRVPDRPSHADRKDLRDMPTGSPPIERGLLRQALLSGIEEYVEYGKEFDHYQSTEGQARIKFTDGETSQRGSLVVGADGFDSKVAKQLVARQTPQRGEAQVPWLRDMGMTVIWGRTPITLEVEQKVDPVLLQRFRIITEDLDDAQYTFLAAEAMRYDTPDKPGPSIPWVLAYGPRSKTVPSDTPAQTAVSLTHHWKPSFSALVSLQDPSQTISRNIHTVDPELGVPQWQTDPHVTVIGDAIHPMAVTGGKGAITAIKDAVTLAKTLIDNHPRTPQSYWSVNVVEMYEQEMRGYASKAVAESYVRAIKAFGVTPMES